MNLDDSICSSQFKKDIGFNVIITWLKENCLSLHNQNFFDQLLPSSNIEEIKKSQLYSDELLSAFERNNPIPMENIPDISIWIQKLQIKGFQLKIDNFKQLYKILKLSNKIKKYLIKQQFPLLYKHRKKIFFSKTALDKIEKIFDNNFIIKKDASQKLKKLLITSYKMQEKINQTMQNQFIHAKKENWLGGDKIVFRNGRAVLPIKSSNKRKIKGVIQDQSSTGQTSFIEPLEIIELNNLLTELEFDIQEEKNQILQDLSSFFQPLSTDIQQSVNTLIFIDKHFTIAKLAYKLKAIKPQLTTNDFIHIDNAINPIFTLSGKQPVPLSLNMNSNKMLILSGPNAGGKSVVLKSIGLYTLMAQCGLFIPAKIIKLPLCTKFMSDIGDRQSIENDLSTFSAHIKNLTYIISSSNKNSLILLDEIGTGTDPDTGAALSQAILESLLNKNSTVIATTHISSLKIWASKRKKVINAGMIFNNENLMPTYKLLSGVPGASYSLEISQRIGLNNSIINRAKEILGQSSTNINTLLNKLETERFLLEKKGENLKEREKKISQSEKEIKKLEKNINELNKKAALNATIEAEKIILSARKEVEKIITEIRLSNANKKSIQKSKQIINSKLKILKDKSEDLIISDQEQINKKDIIKDKIVFIPKLNCLGKIIHKPNKQNKVRLEANGITLNLNLSEIKLAENNIIKHQSKNILNSKNITPKIKSTQLDLRGKRVDEALIETEKFIDSALISEMNFVYILHGRGTGVLMDAIHKFLNMQPYILNFKFANEDHGGNGVTIVEFK